MIQVILDRGFKVKIINDFSHFYTKFLTILKYQVKLLLIIESITALFISGSRKDKRFEYPCGYQAP